MIPTRVYVRRRRGLALLCCVALLGATAACDGAGAAAQPPAARVDAGPTAAERSTFVPPVAKSAKERALERRRMVEQQIERPRDGRTAVKEPAVVAAMAAVPRHVFMPPNVRRYAYSDGALPIEHGQTISQPYIVALMTEHLRLTPQSKVLEVGTGSGYQAAVLAHLTPHVYSIEIIRELAESAERTLKEQGYASVNVRAGDGYQGWPEHAPFDAIIVTCAPEKVPDPLWEQLKPGGRIVIPVGPSDQVQKLVVITKTPDGQRREQTVTEVKFVPMTRRE